MEKKSPIKTVEITQGMTGIDAIEQMLGITVSQADDMAVISIPIKESGKEEPFLVLVKEGKGIVIHLNVVLGFVGSVSIIPKIVEPQSKEVNNYVR